MGQSTGLDILVESWSMAKTGKADYLGLIFSSLAGFDIKESVPLWGRIAKKNKNKEPPAFLSTHPSTKIE